MCSFIHRPLPRDLMSMELLKDIDYMSNIMEILVKNRKKSIHALKLEILKMRTQIESGLKDRPAHMRRLKMILNKKEKRLLLWIKNQEL